MNEKETLNYIKKIGIEMIQNAGSGHPGIVLGAAPILYVLFKDFLNIDLSNQDHVNRDRFIMSAGHGSALLYSLLYMIGELSLEDIKSFRRINSRTPGHPEYLETPLVDMSTGPLGQGVASAVGIALSLKHQNIPGKVYVLCGDGDLMEGVTYEALSFAGNLGLDNLVVLYDSNDVTLDGFLLTSSNEDTEKRFSSIGFDYHKIKEGNDLKKLKRGIDKAIISSKPVLVEIKTKIGEGSLIEGTNKVHGAALSTEDYQQLIKKLEVNEEVFKVPDYLISDFRNSIIKRNDGLFLNQDKKQEKRINLLETDFNDLYKTSEQLRSMNGRLMKRLIKLNDKLIGGSADLGSSTKTYNDLENDISFKSFTGKNINYGVREHGSGAIANGLTLGGNIGYTSTFLAFSDYMKPAIRLAAIMNIPTVFIFTHDSINIGSDGPTHQPIEQLAMLRSIPNLNVYRPCDLNELIGSWDTILHNETPSCLVLSREEVNNLDLTKKDLVQKGAYVLRREKEKLDEIIIATGSEVQLALEIAGEIYEEKNIDIRVVSMPSVDLFLKQGKNYRDEVLPLGSKRIVIEAASSFGWHRFTYSDRRIISVDNFGKSGTKEEVLEHFDFTKEKIKEKVLEIIS